MILRILILCLFLISACAPKKNLVQQVEVSQSTETETLVSSSTSTNTIQSLSEDQFSGQTTSQSNETVTIIREYDTDKPVIETTGYSPVKTETIVASINTLQSQLNNSFQMNSTGFTSSSTDISAYLNERFNLDSLIRVEIESANQHRKRPVKLLLVIFFIFLFSYFFRTNNHKLFQCFFKKLF